MQNNHLTHIFSSTYSTQIFGSHERVGVEKGKSIQEHYYTQNSSWDQQLCVPAQPQVVQSHLLSKVTPEVKKHSQTNTLTHQRIKSILFYTHRELVSFFTRHLCQCLPEGSLV